MIVLGLTNDEKGAQLEQLTVRLFQDIGYRSLTTNLVNAGASEVDVAGTFVTPIPGGGGPETDLIGECKALRRRLNMDEWQKLLGKLFVARLKRQNTIAVLVSLNGFNGNVIAAHRDVDRDLPRVVFLFDRDKVEGLAAKRYGSAVRETVEAGLRRLTRSKVVDLNLAYHGDAVFWLAELSGGRFALLDKSGAPMAGEERETIDALVKTEIGSAELVDLQAEHRSLERQAITSRAQLAKLFDAGGSCSVDDLTVDPEFSPAEHRGGLEMLVSQGLVSVGADHASLSFINANERPSAFHRTVAYFATGKATIASFRQLFDSQLYEESIDEAYAAYACHVQGDVPIPPDRIPDLVFWLRLSPTAMLHALLPDPLIVNHRTDENPKAPMIDENDVVYLFEKMFSLFLEDLRNPNLGRFHHNKGIFEVDTRTQLVIKAPGGTAHQVRSFRRDTSCDGHFGLLTSIRNPEDLIGPEWEDDFFLPEDEPVNSIEP